jgi:hypothetical protein
MHRSYSKDAPNASKADDAVKFSTSKAASYNPTSTFFDTSKRLEEPFYQPLIVCFFLFVFLVYFLLLREENELDELLSKPIEDTVPDIKEMTLVASITHYEKMGLDTRELKEALKIELEKKKKRIEAEKQQKQEEAKAQQQKQEEAKAQQQNQENVKANVKK